MFDFHFKQASRNFSISSASTIFIDVRVPFLIRGPGVIQNKTIKEINVNIDITPTIIDMSGQSFNPYRFDGISLLPYITEEQENYLRTGNFEIILLQEFHIRL